MEDLDSFIEKIEEEFFVSDVVNQSNRGKEISSLKSKETDGGSSKNQGNVIEGSSKSNGNFGVSHENKGNDDLASSSKPVASSRTPDSGSSKNQGNDFASSSKPDSGRIHEFKGKKLVAVTLEEDILNELEGEILEDREREEQKRKQSMEVVDELIKELDLV